jgi:hypothetical protein
MGTMLIVDGSATSRLLFKTRLPKETGLSVHEAADLTGAPSVAAETRPNLVVLEEVAPLGFIKVLEKPIATDNLSTLIVESGA